jgi:hypothetical protein
VGWFVPEGIMAMKVEQTNPTDAAWKVWSQEHADLLGNSLAPQRVLLEAAVRFVAAIAGHPIVTRMAAFFLLHTHLGLTPAQVGAAVGRVTDRHDPLNSDEVPVD